MDAVELVGTLRTVGASLAVDGDRLLVRPKAALTPKLRVALSERKMEVLALLASEEAEVAWRSAVMRPQVPECGPIPFLVARSVPSQDGRCLSCGDLLAGDRRYRCGLCVEAALRLLNEVREGVLRRRPHRNSTAGHDDEGQSTTTTKP